MRFPELNSHDSKGFNDDETEAYREMHQEHIALNAKFGCLGYTLLIVGLIIAYIVLSFFE